MNHPLSEAAKKILSCCRHGQLNQMLDLLDQGLAIEDVNHPDFAPLNVALKHGRWKVAKHLLASQMVPQDHHCPPLIAATQYKKDMIQGLELVFSQTGNLDVTDRNRRTALMTACLLGHEKKVSYLLQNLDSITEIDNQGMDAFLDAVISQSATIVELLINHGANVHHCNHQGDNALLIAMQQPTPSAKIIKTLLDHQVDSTARNQSGKSAYQVAEKKHPSILKLFIAKIEAEKQMELPLFETNDVPVVADTQPVSEPNDLNSRSETPPNAQPAATKSNSPIWFTAISEGNLGRLNKLRLEGVPIDLMDGKGCTGLIHACGKGHRAVASFLIQNNANIEHKSENGSSPLSSAIISNSRALVGLLLSHGADPNGTGPGDYPLLSLAATQWSEACVNMLLDAGAHINTVDQASLSLYHHVAIAAEYYGNTAKAKATLRLIHQHGLNINVQNNQGNTALHLLCGATKAKKYQADDSHIANITHEMLKLGADPKLVNNQGFTAIQYAKKHALLNTKGVILSFIDAW